MKKTTFGLAALALTVGILGASAASTSAYQGGQIVTCSNYSAERHEAIENAFENDDYDAWKDLMQGRGRVLEVINEDNFSDFAKVHELMEEGRVAEAQEIRQELGLGFQNGFGNRMSRGMGRGMGGGMYR
jgi:hypothetical protein